MTKLNIYMLLLIFLILSADNDCPLQSEVKQIINLSVGEILLFIERQILETVEVCSDMCSWFKVVYKKGFTEKQDNNWWFSSIHLKGKVRNYAHAGELYTSKFSLLEHLTKKLCYIKFIIFCLLSAKTNSWY